MIIVLKNGDEETSANVDPSAEAGSVRELSEQLEEVGAPSNYDIAVNGVKVSDSHNLSSGDVVSFRPRTSEKG